MATATVMATDIMKKTSIKMKYSERLNMASDKK